MFTQSLVAQKLALENQKKGALILKTKKDK